MVRRALPLVMVLGVLVAFLLQLPSVSAQTVSGFSAGGLTFASPIINSPFIPIVSSGPSLVATSAGMSPFQPVQVNIGPLQPIQINIGAVQPVQLNVIALPSAASEIAPSTPGLVGGQPLLPILLDILPFPPSLPGVGVSQPIPLAVSPPVAIPSSVGSIQVIVF